MGAPEAYVEKYLKSQAEKHGYICWKLSSPGYQGVSGLPDRIVIGNGNTFYIECKRPGGKPTKIQVKRINSIREQGGIACVIDTREKVDEFLRYIDGDIDIPLWYFDNPPVNTTN